LTEGKTFLTNIGIKARQVGKVSILDMAGNGRISLRFGASTVSLPKAVQSLLEGGHPHIVLNLARVEYIDAAGLGDLVSSQITVNDKGGRIKLLNLGDKLRELLKITKLLTVFEVYECESEALDSFEKRITPPILEGAVSAA
jgi:anti-sigma B factor antagonist